MTYFEEKGFGFLRPDGGGKDIFFHISRLHQGDATALVPGAKVAYDLGMDRNGKIAASSVRLLTARRKSRPPDFGNFWSALPSGFGSVFDPLW